MVRVPGLNSTAKIIFLCFTATFIILEADFFSALMKEMANASFLSQFGKQNGEQSVSIRAAAKNEFIKNAALNPCSQLERWAENVPHMNWTSDHPIILGAGEGTTATRFMARMLASMGFEIGHWEELYSAHPELDPKNTSDLEFLSSNKTRVQEWKYDHSNLMSIKPDELDAFDFKPILDKYEGVMDTPISSLFPYIFRQYPNSKVILSLRDPRQWTKSRVQNHPGAAMPMMSLSVDSPDSLRGSSRSRTYPNSAFEFWFSVYNTMVTCVVPKTRLLVINVFEQDPEQIAAKMKQFIRNE
mmetsp:Transcript_11021/g.27053  ORF Transcript_11021/g.27053 Transcript_11021/m.27053 type:complete len:300 (-) Transcript_11021:97-996(-)